MLSLLTAFMLVSVAFIPAVSSQSEMRNAEDALKKVMMEIVTDTEDLKESYATDPLEDGKEQKYFVRQWKTEVDGKEVWKLMYLNPARTDPSHARFSSAETLTTGGIRAASTCTSGR